MSTLKREAGRTGAFFAEVKDAACEEEKAAMQSPTPDLATRPRGGRVFAPKCLCLLSKYPFVEASRTWLLQLYRLSCSPTRIPLERYICNFLLEVPTPVPGRVDVQYSMLDLVLYYPCPSPHQPVLWSGGLSLEAVFECLSPKNLLRVFNAVLLEQQVLLHSTQLSLLTAVAEFLTACMWPLAYSHVFIPILPRQCLYLCANSPVPFLLGCHTDSFRVVADQLPDTVSVVDLDLNQVYPASGVSLPNLPERRQAKLLRAIHEHANLFEAQQRYLQKQKQLSKEQRRVPPTPSHSALPPAAPPPLLVLSVTSTPSSTTARTAAATRLPASPLILSQSRPPPCLEPASHLGASTTSESSLESPLSPLPSPSPHRILRNLDDPFSQARRSLQVGAGEAGVMTEEDWDAIRDAFLGFFLAILREYRKFLVFPSKEDPKPKLEFRRTDFVASHPSEWAPFLEEFSRTQALQSFLDARLQPDPEDVGEISLFDELIEARKRGKPRFSMGAIGGNRRQASFRRPVHFRHPKEIKTLVALQPDVSSLPDEPFIYDGFPMLQEKWYTPPRPVNDLAGRGPEDDGRGWVRRRGRRRRGIKKRNHILRFKSDHIPWDPATSVFSTFLMTFCLTIGRDLQQQHDVSFDAIQRQASEHLVTSKDATSDGESVIGPEGTNDPSVDRLSVTEREHGKQEEGEEGKGEPAIEELDKRHYELGSDSEHKISHQFSAAASFRLRPRMRCLSEDKREERVHAAIGKLTIAFDVLKRMRAQRTPADEWIYRCLIDAASRLGAVDMALQALTEMNEAGFAVDASVVSTLLSGAASSQASQALSLLDWNKIRQRNDGRSGSSGGSGTGHYSVHGSQKHGARLSSGTPKVFKEALSAFRKIGTPGQSGFWSLSNGGNGGSADGRNQTGVGRGGEVDNACAGNAGVGNQGSWERQSTRGTQVIANPVSLPFELILDESARRDAEARAFQSDSNFGSGAKGGEREGANEGEAVSDSKSDATAYNTPSINFQVKYGESLLNVLFPNLALDVDSETCPQCNSRLSAAEIQSGWLPDPNNYTTSCPLCETAREAKIKEQQRAIQQHQQQQGMNHLLDFKSLDLSGVDRDRRSSVISRPIPPPPVRRFVARFSVHCTASDWIGSTGPGTPLWCEYLSPWVLRKEIQTILLNDGIDSILSAAFRKSSAASSTIFWNLILWYRDFALPVAFLLQNSVEGAATAPLI